MKLVIMEHPAIGGATWSVIQLQEHMNEAVWTMMGHKVLDIPEKKAKEMVEAQRVALNLQVQLRELYYSEPEPS